MDYGIECNSGYYEIVEPKVTCDNGNWKYSGECMKGCYDKEIEIEIKSCSDDLACDNKTDYRILTIGSKDKISPHGTVISSYDNENADQYGYYLLFKIDVGNCPDDDVYVRYKYTCNNGNWKEGEAEDEKLHVKCVNR